MEQKDKLIVGEIYETIDRIYYSENNINGNAEDISGLRSFGTEYGDKFVVIKKIVKTYSMNFDEDSIVDGVDVFICYLIRQNSFFCFYTDGPLYIENFHKHIRRIET